MWAPLDLLPDSCPAVECLVLSCLDRYIGEGQAAKVCYSYPPPGKKLGIVFKRKTSPETNLHKLNVDAARGH